MRRLICFILVGLLAGLFVFSFSHHSIKATDGTWNQNICINVDGSVFPTDAPVLRNGELYLLTKDVAFDPDENLATPERAVVIQRSGIVFDGTNHCLSGTGLFSGIVLENVDDVTIRNLTITGFEYCISLFSSSGCSIYSNNIDNPGRYGVGISLANSNYNTLYANDITNNYYFGVELANSTNNSLIGNNIKNNNNCGISLDSASSHNLLRENNVSGNSIVSFSSSYNKIFHNLFEGNNLVESNGLNMWDDGFPSGGNFWSDYIGFDATNDGIGDTPYVIDENNKDNYPLMNSDMVLAPQPIPES